tara:strand:+ start:743 stop:1816 length:1074 start_codon:yes stop_codon:yes gene_type:complete
MMQKNYNVIGIMSGTSLDGVDLAYISFTKFEKWTYEIIISETIGYSDEWIKILKNIVHLSSDNLESVDINYTNLLSELVLDFIKRHNIKNIDAICSHGHTAFHKPDLGKTYQIGNLPLLATFVNQLLVCDFRTQDVNLGGQGAPLVPLGDKLLFSNYDACLNLGGFSNISLDLNNERVAFDICPINIVLNELVSTIGLKYDDKGHLASKGKLHIELYFKLNQLEYYKKPYPKSLGLEWVNDVFFPIIKSYEISLEDKLHTLVEHMAFQISEVIKSCHTVLFTGGGVYNTYLMSRINHFSEIKIIIPDSKLIEFKEALIFGFLGVLKLRNEVNCLASVTGASKNHSSGKIFRPTNSIV